MFLYSAEERKRKLALKSARNPASKQLPAVRRKKSEVAASGESASTISTLDLNSQLDFTDNDDEQSQTSRSEMFFNAPLDFESVDEVHESPPEVSAPSSSDGSNATVSSFQSEFLKMLSSRTKLRTPAETSEPWSWPTEQKVKKKSSGERKSRKRSSVGRSSVAKSPDSKLAASCTVTGEQSAVEIQEADYSDSYLQGSSSSAEQTGSLTDSSATVSLTESSISNLLSLFTNESGQILWTDAFLPDCSSLPAESGPIDMSDILPSTEKPERSSCESYDDDREKSGSTVRADVSPPDLSPPGAEVDINVNPPVLEPYDGVTDAGCLLASDRTISHTVSAEVSGTGSTSGQRSPVGISDCSVNELKTLDCTGSDLRSERSLSDVLDRPAPSSDVASVTYSSSTRPDTSDVVSAVCPTGLKAVEAITVNPQQCGSSVAGRPTGSAFRYSALARFRPAVSARSVLPPTGRVRSSMPRPTRPNRP